VLIGTDVRAPHELLVHPRFAFPPSVDERFLVTPDDDESTELLVALLGLASLAGLGRLAARRA
jgi:hypothetical protein